VFSGQTNENLRFFGASLATYIYQALMFVTYNSDEKPFPFAPWPESEMPVNAPEPNDEVELSTGELPDDKKSAE
jgi:hypothetical protein